MKFIRKEKFFLRTLIARKTYIYYFESFLSEYNNITISGLKNSKIFYFAINAYKNKIKFIKIVNDIHGCNLCEIEFNDKLNFEIEPFTKIEIRYNNQNLFYGFLDYVSQDKKNPNKFLFKGLVEQLKRVRFEKNYNANLKIIDIINDLFLSIKNETDIRYNINKIDFTSNNTIFPVNIQIGKSNIYEIFNKLTKIINYVWGVDANGDFFCYQLPNKIKKTFFENLVDAEIFLDFKNIKNVITIKRQVERNSNSTGWTIGSVKTDFASVAKYGKKFYDLLLPGYFDDQSCDIVANQILNDAKEPKYQFKINKYIFKKNKLINFDLGKYKLITKFDYDFLTINDCDDINKIIFDNNDTSASEIITNNVGDFISGAGALKIYNVNSNSQKTYLFLNNLIYGKTKSILFYAKTNFFNDTFLFKLKFGSDLNNLNIIDFKINTNYYKLYKIEIDYLNLNYIMIQLNEPNPANKILFIDKIFIECYTNKHIVNTLTKTIYEIKNDLISVDLEFEYDKEIFENFVKNLISESESLKYISEKRSL